MSQADSRNTTASDPTRRKMLASLATAAVAVPAAALPALASASGEVDPIYRAIDSHKAAWARWSAACRDENDDHEDEVNLIGDEEVDAAVVLLEVQPTTAAGILALLRYTYEHMEAGHVWAIPHEVGDAFEDEVIRVAADALTTILRAT